MIFLAANDISEELNILNACEVEATAVDYDPKFKDTPWKDRGYVAWNLWGGTSGVNWAIKKMESIRNE